MLHLHTSHLHVQSCPRHSFPRICLRFCHTAYVQSCQRSTDYSRCTCTTLFRDLYIPFHAHVNGFLPCAYLLPSLYIPLHLDHTLLSLADSYYFVSGGHSSLQLHIVFLTYYFSTWSKEKNLAAAF